MTFNGLAERMYKYHLAFLENVGSEASLIIKQHGGARKVARNFPVNVQAIVDLEDYINVFRFHFS